MSVPKLIIDITREYIDNNAFLFQELPINLDKLIQKEGISVINYPFEDDISGVLVIENDNATIGINKKSSNVRKRFTLAHELGHFKLHTQKSKMFMDNVFFRKKSEGYTSKEEKIEKEANYFAANILMPEHLVRGEIAELKCDLHDDVTIASLANKFEVSSSAMTFRLINLGLI
ncbi:ImmA/IrrE family metallo-endopeptidase [Chryseobacterium gambrini]|uniref:ImmA/IrrE family metallo-endopeptidase n=1 Tax=Chryseobacterium gambrini TaxID=373672 RepID=A0ABM8K7L0_9FLAO|nr:ImmA/IrrE family metallo-endopeptidase [Chryseobacterium gambrini]